MSPKRPCTRPLPLLWTRGLRPAYRINRGPGSFQPRASRLSTECAGGRVSTAHRKTSHSTSRRASTKRPHEDEEIEDDRLRLIFTCCHPALPPEGQVALTLREVCGLTTEEIARAFLVAPSTLAQRIVRAKAVIRDKAVPYQVPASQELPARLGAVLQVVYLVFNEGYSAGATGAELSREAIRLGRLLAGLLPEPEAMGLLGLMLLQESRRAARISAEGDLILLDQQDRSLWNREQIVEGISFTENALASHRFGAYTLQAAIAAVHAEASSPASTDWRQITLLYNQLIRIHPSPVVELNRAVAIAMCEGPEQGLRLIDALAGARGTRELPSRALRPGGLVPQAGKACGGA